MKTIASLLAACLLAGCAATAPMSPAPAVHAVAASTPHTPGKTEILWLGQSAMRITTPGGKVLMVDPWLTSNPKTPPEFKKLEALGHIDAIFVSHGHFDHVADALPLAKLTGAPLWGTAGMGQVWQTYAGLTPQQAPRFGKGGTITPFGPGGPKITAVHAEHSSEMAWKDAAGNNIVLPGGEPQGFVFEMENGFRIYYTGDTSVFGDMRLIADMYRPDLVILPIGGHYVMNPQDAAMAVREMLHPKYAMPVHYLTTPELPGTPAEFKAALGASPVQMVVIDPGQKVEF